MQINIKDLVDFLLCAIKVETESISLDDDEYILTATFQTKEKKCVLQIFISQVDEKVLAVEFKKVSGNIDLYLEKVKIIKGLMKLLLIDGNVTEDKVSKEET